ncbi:hypothetical protein MauCBS54593_003758 [Microsporum audouinii]
MAGRIELVLPDTLYHLDPLPNNIVQIQTYPSDQIRFSRQLDYSKDLNALSSIPIPRLATLLQGASQRYLESKVYAMAVCVEELVDGMNLDEAWCLDHLDTRKHRVMEFILDRWLQSALLFLNAVMVNLKSAIFHQPLSHPVDFQYISDLHLEDGQLYETFVVPRTAPYLILAGDIGCLRNYKEYVTFLAAQCAQFDHVFLVLGNHKFYWISLQYGLQAAKALEGEPPLFGKFTVLNRNRVDINRRVTILGCTLWSHIPEVSQLWVRMKVADFSIIKDWTVEAHNTEHNRDVQWLQQEIYNISLEEEKHDVIVVTHHSPSFMKTADPRHKSHPWGPAFCSDLLESQVKSWQGSKAIRCWIFGHTHWNTDFRYRDITISSNQFKYDSRRVQGPGFFSFWPTQLGKHFVITKIAKV